MMPNLFAQNGASSSYSPYSVFAVGDLVREGTAYNKTMGGVGIAGRDHHYINYLNPAALAARDTLSFMLDFGVSNDNKYFSQRQVGAKNLTSVNNLFNISNFVLSFPIWKSSAMAVGVTPFSGVGYDFSYNETRPEVIGHTGNINYQSYGEGTLTKVFLSAGATFWKCFSIGAEIDYYFGNIEKVANTIFDNQFSRDIYGGYDMKIWGLGGKFGLQYEQRFNYGTSLTLGATYRLRTPIHGTNEEYFYAILSNVQDSLYTKKMATEGIALGDEIGVGISLKLNNRWMIEFDYLRGDWRSSGFSSARGFAVNTESGQAITSTISQSFRVGVDFVPNRNDIRYYYRRMSYRAGAYYETENFTYAGNQISSCGITLGVTLPVYRWNNGFTLGIDFGKRGTLKSGMIREMFFKVHASINIHDIWFQKPKYE
ncbi:MAG: hypothetical protein J6Y32_00350 [Bacteroidales bacterium]|nr:hypothetical protein [Bacteroidales bacterium]